MSFKKVAFISGKQGPWISVRGVSSLRIKVQGLRDGLIRVVHSLSEDASTRDEVVAVGEDGVHQLGNAEWMRVEHEGSSRQVLCFISGR